MPKPSSDCRMASDIGMPHLKQLMNWRVDSFRLITEKLLVFLIPDIKVMPFSLRRRLRSTSRSASGRKNNPFQLLTF